MLIRQGDVLLVPVSEAPASQPVPRRQGRLVLATGELSGHAHAVADEHAELVTAEGASQLYLLVHGEPATLSHEEHTPLIVPPGTYRVVRQREYDPVAAMAERYAYD
ncbi:MAG TPA: hypothetical protein VLJ44_03340 [Gaiellaceae bacterium]|nr:hypothetical protein [Gaiellaceae bacterium]